MHLDESRYDSQEICIDGSRGGYGNVDVVDDAQ